MSCHRRRFLKAAATSAAAGSFLAAGPWPGRSCGASPAGPPGSDADGGPYAPAWRPLREKFPDFPEPTGLKIRSIETFTHGPTVSVVRLRTDDGAEGWGQISTFDADISAEVLHRKIAPLALGRDPAGLDNLVDRAIEANYKFPWSYVCRALSGVDTAIFDLLAKRADKGVCELLGGKARPLPVYGSSMSRSITPADEAARLRRLRDQQGFRAFKVRVGSVCGHDRDAWPGRTDELIPTIREAVGEGIDLLADGNSCYTPPKAIEVGRLMEESGYWHFEEPCPYWELEWTAEVAAALKKVNVAGGEQDNNLAQWRRMVRMGAVDIVQPDLLYVGGLTRGLRVAEMAGRTGRTCVPHSANLGLVTVFTLHMFAAIPNAGRHVEFTIENNDWTGFYDPQLEVRDGKVAVPAGPGWGVTIRPDWLAKAEHKITRRD